MENNKKNIFIHAVSQRCGHNYLSRLIESQSDYKVMIHNNHEVIFPEIIAKKMEELTVTNMFVRNKKAKVLEIKKAAESYSNQGGKLIFKTSTLTSRHEIDLFTNMKHIILVRNPRDLFVSYEKSIYNFRVNSFKNRIKKLLRPIYSYYVLRKWTKLIDKAIAAYKSAESNYLLIKYEDLITIEGQKKLFDFLKHPIELNQVIKIKNINSSYAEKSKRWKKNSKNIGDTTKRYQNAPHWLRWMIDKYLKKYLKTLNYTL